MIVVVDVAAVAQSDSVYAAKQNDSVAARLRIDNEQRAASEVGAQETHSPQSQTAVHTESTHRHQTQAQTCQAD